MSEVEAEIREIVNRETRAWDTKDVRLLLSVFHPDMVWPWPPTARHHDPSDWVFWAGRYDYERWRRSTGRSAPTRNTIAAAYGSWLLALQAAGLDTGSALPEERVAAIRARHAQTREARRAAVSSRFDARAARHAAPRS